MSERLLKDERKGAGEQVTGGLGAPTRAADPRPGGDAGDPDSGGARAGTGTNSFAQQEQDASSTGLEGSASHDPAGLPGGRAQQDGGALRDEEGGPGKRGSAR